MKIQKRPKLRLNNIFSILLVCNILTFIFGLPALILRFHFSKKFLILSTVYLIANGISFLYLYFSYRAFFYGIDVDVKEGMPTRYGPLSGGDNEFFKIFSKPIAFLIAILILLFQILIIRGLYE